MDTMEGFCEELRARIGDLGKEVLRLKEMRKGMEDEFVGQTSEIMANTMLSYRHLEDARMRIGKVMQQLQGGVSIFDRKKKD